MKILLGETDGKIWALDPETGEKLTTIIDPNTRCDDDLTMTTAYVRHQGIFWNSWHEARKQLFYHAIITDDDPESDGYEIVDDDDPAETPTVKIVENADELPAKIPIINRASFDPADMLAENMTIRQVYKCSAMETLLSMDFIHELADINPILLARAAGCLANAMITEDKRHDEKGR